MLDNYKTLKYTGATWFIQWENYEYKPQAW